MKIYNYHPETLEFLGEGKAAPSPLEPGNYLIPVYATELVPPELKANEAAVFADNEWKVVADYRNKIFYDKNTKEEVRIDELGVNPDSNLTEEKPGEFDEWDEEKIEWALTVKSVQEVVTLRIKKTAHDSIIGKYSVYKQMNINEQQGYTEQDKTEMWEFINAIRDQSKKMVTEIQELNNSDNILNFKIDFET